MEIIIDIPEDTFEWVKKYKVLIDEDIVEVAKALSLGSPFVEHCEDAISRERALGMAITKQYNAKQIGNIGNLTNDEVIRDWNDMIDFIENLPSVQPKEKVGHWVLLDDCSNSGFYCSECHKKIVKEGWSDTVKKIKYCPYCATPLKVKEKENE